MEQINQIINLIKEKGLYPDIKTVSSASKPEVIIGGKKYLLFCSNNYLGLSTNKNVVNAAIKAIRKYGLSPCSARLMSGTSDLHEKLERKIAEFKKTESAMVFSTGYGVNIGIIPAIFNGIDRWQQALGINKKSEKGLIISDELNHACIIDGCHLANVDKAVYKHKDLRELEKILKANKNNKNKLIITESVFSLDGDIAPLPEIVSLAKKYNSLIMVDEAHGTGIFGKHGHGLTEHFGLEKEVDIKMGTFSKTLGGVGGFIASSKDLVDFLRISARSYIFTASPAYAMMAGVHAAIEEIENHPELREKLWENVNYARNGFKNLGFDIMGSESQIIPILIGDEKKAIKMAKILFDEGVFSLCVRYTAVPLGKARIRFSLMTSHTKKNIDYLLDKLNKIGKKLEII